MQEPRTQVATTRKGHETQKPLVAGLVTWACLVY